LPHHYADCTKYHLNTTDNPTTAVIVTTPSPSAGMAEVTTAFTTIYMYLCYNNNRYNCYYHGYYYYCHYYTTAAVAASTTNTTPIYTYISTSTAPISTTYYG